MGVWGVVARCAAAAWLLPLPPFSAPCRGRGGWCTRMWYGVLPSAAPAAYGERGCGVAPRLTGPAGDGGAAAARAGSPPLRTPPAHETATFRAVVRWYCSMAPLRTEYLPSYPVLSRTRWARHRQVGGPPS